MGEVTWNKVSYYDYYGHNTIKDFSEMVDVNKFYKWCFVRNPWSRILSGYDHSAQFKNVYNTFEKFVHAVYKYKATYQKLNYKWEAIEGGVPDLTNEMPIIFLMNQKSFITINDMVKVDFIGRYENLQSDWKKLCSIMKSHKPVAINQSEWDKEMDNCTLPHLRNSKTTSHSIYIDKPWREYYTQELKDLVGEIYNQDIKEFNYSFD